jgi:hypothetical protein
MPKRVTPLSDIQVKSAKPKEADYKLSDGGGMFLLVTTSGGRLWRLKYSFEGNQGVYGSIVEDAGVGARLAAPKFAVIGFGTKIGRTKAGGPRRVDQGGRTKARPYR